MILGFAVVIDPSLPRRVKKLLTARATVQKILDVFGFGAYVDVRTSTFDVRARFGEGVIGIEGAAIFTYPLVDGDDNVDCVGGCVVAVTYLSGSGVRFGAGIVACRASDNAHAASGHVFDEGTAACDSVGACTCAGAVAIVGDQDVGRTYTIDARARFVARENTFVGDARDGAGLIVDGVGGRVVDTTYSIGVCIRFGAGFSTLPQTI